MKKGIVKIEKLDHFGRGIAREQGCPIFIENALPEEMVEIELTEIKKRYMVGKVTKWIDKSKKRVIPKCKYYGHCGGCDIMHLSYDEQLSFKQNKVKEIMTKFIGYNDIKKIINTNQYHYRNKVTLQVKEKIGYYKKKSYEIVCIDNCLIADERINSLIKRLKLINLNNINQIIIRVTETQMMLGFWINDIIDENQLINKFKDIDSLFLIYKDEVKNIYGSEYITEDINGLKFVISPTSFFQVNTDGMKKLYAKAIEVADISKEDNVLDLYCGTGTIGIYASLKANQVLGIEINDTAIKDATMNKEINHINNIDFKVGDVKKVLSKTNFNSSIIFVDPPRAGLDNTTINKIIELSPKKVIYISCDPVTLARDLNILLNKYDIQEIILVDMFPNTYHVECLCVLNMIK